jgi:hypothetical protein
VGQLPIIRQIRVGRVEPALNNYIEPALGYDFKPETNLSHQVAGRTKIMSSPGFAVAVVLPQLLLATKPEATIVETG